MAAIVTTNMRVHAATQFESGFSDNTQFIYLFIGRTLPWSDDSMPPAPIDCEKEESSAYRDMIALKRIGGNDVSLIMPRNTWAIGTVYTQFQNDIDLFNPTSGLPPFYVVTDALNVYKCLNNNNGAASTIQPTGTSTAVVTNADGYQWKYMLTINSADVLSFVTSEWVPVSTLTQNDGSNQWLVQQAAIPGTIDRIDMLTSGTQYTQVPTVTIIGDGSGAAAVATISGGNVVAITMTNNGSGYTYANISITNGGVASNGATAKPVISPFKGHGSDATSELGGYFVLVNAKLIHDESGSFTISNDFRRIGIVKDPVLSSDGSSPATELDYQQSVRLTFSTISGTTFAADEVVTGSTSNSTGVVLDWTPGTAVLRLVETTGAFVPGETVVGANCSGVLLTYAGTAVSATSTTIVLPSGASSANDFYTGQTIKILTGTGSRQIRKIIGYVGVSRTATVNTAWSPNPDNTSTFKIANIVPPDLVPYSGQILYLENRRPIARASNQTEDVKIVVEF